MKRGERSQIVMTDLASISVLLPTKNGERYLSEVLAQINAQQGNFQLCEVIAIDSGSRDRTVEILRRHQVRLWQIQPQEFGHGKTRNFAAAQTRGEFLVFLSQDATPADEHWLENLLAPLREDPLVAGAFSRHQPRPNCHPMEWHRIVAYELHSQSEVQVYSAVGNPDYEQNPARYRIFANNSSVIRRAVWEQIPFPEVEFGEDQAWAEQVLKAGYKTAYAAKSVVIHSHSYGPWVNFCRHFEHAWAMHELFAQPRRMVLRDCLPAALRVARADLAFWYHQNGRSKTEVLQKWALPAVSWHLAANLGLWLGERTDALPRRLSLLFSLQERLKRK
jgi:rhamnosyltransferase